MPRYPGAKWDPIPENSTQATINPTQWIVHSVIAPWTADRIGQYWRESTNLESHFGLGYTGRPNQYVDTTVRADANAQANVRAVSVETASNTSGTDPWTAEQLEELVLMGVWLNQTHGIPAHLPASWSSPGMGYHRLYPEWSTSGTACPGNARVAQFNDYVLPEINRRLNPPPPPEEEVIEVLNTANAIDVTLSPVGGTYLPLAFGDQEGLGADVILGGDRKHSTFVHLLLAGAHPETVLTGRFYLTDEDDINGKSNFLPQSVRSAEGAVFTNAGYVPANKHLHFEVKVSTPDGSTVVLAHRLAQGLFAAGNPVG